MKCQVDAIQWGGVVAEMFRGLQKPSRFSGGGGGVVAEIFRGLQKPARFQWERGSTIHFPLMGPLYIFGLFKGGGPGIGHCTIIYIAINMISMFNIKLASTNRN